IGLPAIVAEAFAEGFAKSNSAMPIRAMKNRGVLISDYYTARTQHVTMARPRSYRVGPLQRPFQTYTAASLVRPWILRSSPTPGMLTVPGARLRDARCIR